MLSKAKWYESLRFKVEMFSAAVGILFGISTLLLFGPMIGDWLVHLIFCVLGTMMFSLFVYHSIWVRQLSLPAMIVVIIYSLFSFQGDDLYQYLKLCSLGILTMIVIGFVEARTTTGMYRDYWRSFFFHPLGWSKHFKNL